MFTGLNITNILGHRDIDNDTPFIIISCDDMNKFLDKLEVINSHTIYRLNLIKLREYMGDKVIDFDINNFLSVGDLCSERKITQILLANKNIVPCSSAYTNIGKLGKMTMWIAKMKRKTSESRSMGIILTEGSIPSYETPVVPKSYLVNMDFGQSLLKGNDFNVLNVWSDGLLILIRDKFNTSPKWKNYGDYKDYKDYKDTSRQGNYSSVRSERKKNSNDTDKMKENNNKTNESTWANVKGKTLVLKNRDNPWFTNKTIVKNIENINLHTKPRDNTSNITKEGFSNYGRLGKLSTPLKNKKQNTTNHFVVVLLVIILLIVLIIKISRKR